MVTAAKKKKTLAVQLVAEPDPELFNKDLDWYFNCFDSESGLRSLQGGMSDVLAMKTALDANKENTRPVCKTCGHRTSRAPFGRLCKKCGVLNVSEPCMPVKHANPGRGLTDPYGDDGCVRFNSEQSNLLRQESTFARGRRVWGRFSQLPWSVQQEIRLLYEPRRIRPVMDEARIRAANRAYLEAK
jgi:hypothetical protein